MPVRNSGGDFGELHVKLIVNFPASLSANQIKLVKKIFPIDDQELPNSEQAEKVESDDDKDEL